MLIYILEKNEKNVVLYLGYKIESLKSVGKVALLSVRIGFGYTRMANSVCFLL